MGMEKVIENYGWNISTVKTNLKNWDFDVFGNYKMNKAEGILVLQALNRLEELEAKFANDGK